MVASLLVAMEVTSAPPDVSCSPNFPPIFLPWLGPLYMGDPLLPAGTRQPKFGAWPYWLEFVRCLSTELPQSHEKKGMEIRVANSMFKNSWIFGVESGESRVCGGEVPQQRICYTLQTSSFSLGESLSVITKSVVIWVGL